MHAYRSHLQVLPIVLAVAAAQSQEPLREPSKAFAGVAQAAKVSKLGLEAASGPIAVRVERLTLDAETIGLTTEGLRTHTERRLREAGVPAFRKAWPELNVRVTVAGSAFSVDVSFVRDVLYSDGTNVWKKIAITWTRSNAGTHARNPESLVSALDQLLDQFLEDFQKANPR